MSVLNCTENYIRKVLLPDDRNPGGKCMDGSQPIMTKLTEKVSADKADKSERIDLAQERCSCVSRLVGSVCGNPLNHEVQRLSLRR